ncbi:MAG: precorrin-6A reductase [Selenomonadaceae bacterium]|nr:precorrin-6A reductase [Selenomonadaceae bacterium]
MKIFLIAGTEDGRKLAKFLFDKNFEVTASVVSEYGKKILEQYEKIKINDKKLNSVELEKILRDENFKILVDASHPYAENISQNAITACENSKIFYIRYERPEVEITYKKIFRAESYEQAAEISASLGKNIFLTTGSRNLKKFVECEAVKNCNITARILPTAEVLSECEKFLSPKKIIAIQGKFSTELNVELFKHAQAEVIVTKNSGEIGGADTKIAAAEILNLPVVIIDRPKIFYPRVAKNFDEVLKEIEKWIS